MSSSPDRQGSAPHPGPLENGAHHGLSAHEVVLVLDTDPKEGLQETEARDRLERFGPNRLPAAEGHGALRRLWAQLHNPLIYVLLAAGSIAAALGEMVDAGVIFGVVAINALVGFAQESRAKAELDALRRLVRTTVRVVRAGTVRNLGSEAVVPGDLVLLGAGEKVPADLRLVEETDLEADESALTGESVPVVKDEVVLPVATAVADRRNMLYSGTLITSGSGSGVVVATGRETEIGEIHRLVGSVDTLDTPLTQKLTRFARILTVAILALAAVAFLAGVLRGERAAEMFTASVALAVGAIPEGLPAAVTITLAIGVGRLARKRAVIRRLPAVETLGSTTVVCTDKTGTLTANEMTVRRISTASGTFEVTGSGYDPRGDVLTPSGAAAALAEHEDLRWCLTTGVLCNDASWGKDHDGWHVTGDPTEGALLVVAEKAGLHPGALTASHPRTASIPFSSESRYMATFHDSPEGPVPLVMVKGATEQVLDLSEAAMGPDGGRQRLDREGVEAAAHQLAVQGLRVLAFAVGRDPTPSQDGQGPAPGPLTFVGLQAMRDPPRPEIAGAVRACHDAGVAVKMITGDHEATATAIAKEVQILEAPDGRRTVTGSTLGSLGADEYAQAVDQADVFARVSPEQKLRLVEALQRDDHVVAMTGDGVNDAPALRQADIGVAMGRAGTEVAKDAADMVLTDDSFATIEAAVEEGRGIFDNLLKFIVWTLPTNLAEGLVILLAIVLGTALPILPSQILWINMTTAVLLGLTLAFEAKEPGIMQRPPRDPTRPLLTVDLVVRTLFVSGLLVAATWWLFDWERSHGMDLAVARTTAVNLFVMVEALYLLSCRSLEGPSWRRGLFSNPWLLGGLLVQAVAQALLTYVPTFQQLFQTAPMSGGAWLRTSLVALVAMATVTVVNRLWREVRTRAGPHRASPLRHR